MRSRSYLLAGLFGLIAQLAAACVDVPDSVRAQFAGPGPQDPSNYRRGARTAAPAQKAAPKADPPTEVAAATTTTAAPTPAPEEERDGGAP